MLQLTNNSLTVLKRRYLAKDEKGTVVEDPPGMFGRVSHDIAEDEEQEREFYDLMTSFRFLPCSPTLMNAGRRLQMLSACFVLPIDDTMEDIFQKVKETALVHKGGGGTGFSFSRLRPKGDVVGSTGGVSSGPCSFIDAFNAGTEVVKQGSTRRGANMAVLNCSHPDILEFVETKAKDPTRWQNFNVSVAATDEFMEAVKGQKHIDLVNPRTKQVVDRVFAPELFNLICESAWASGDPGLWFIDTVNRTNPNKHKGIIESCNPCGEQELSPYESCNLGSINLALHVKDKSFDYDLLRQTINTSVQFLDNVIDRNKYPLPEQEVAAKASRRIGLGIMGWAEALIKMEVPYDSTEAIVLAEEVMDFIHKQTHLTSSYLAEIKGCYPSWVGSEYQKNGIQMRNTSPTTIAPTGTISIIAGCSSGIEPLFAIAYERFVMDNDRLPEFNQLFEEVARREGFWTERVQQHALRYGSIQECLEVPGKWREIFKTSHDISPLWQVKVQAAFQKHTDNAVSKTINMPHEATVNDIRNAYLEAYESGCKGITIYRDGSKDNQVLSVPSYEEHYLGTEVKPRPRVVEGETHFVPTGHGAMYVTVNRNGNNKPFEVFGNLGKAGDCQSAYIEAVCRLTSIALRSGVSAEEIVGQLGGITCCPVWDEGVQIKSIPDGIAHILSHTENIPLEYSSLLNCPECSTKVLHEEGCLVCKSCGWTKC
jgi:ribonucleoside-diphosphate reductase alpha chain